MRLGMIVKDLTWGRGKGRRSDRMWKGRSPAMHGASYGGLKSNIVRL